MPEEVNKQNKGVKQPKKKRTVRRELIEWGVIIAIGAFLYLTGLHTTVIGTVQGLVLKTGLIKPRIENDKPLAKADYNFRLVNAEGQVLNGIELVDKTVFINLWATWCPPCIAEMPDINRLYNEISSEDIVFLMISLDDEFSKAINFVEKKGYDFEIYQFTTDPPASLYSQIIPTTFVFSPDGNIVVRKEGMAKYNSDSFKEFLKSM